MLQVYRTSSIEWKPSPVIALATSIDESQVAAVREDGSLEVWLVSPGSVGWHCQLTIHGDPQRRVSSLVWCRSRGMPSGRLFSSSFDGSVTEWDLFDLKQKIVLESNAVTIWQMAAAPSSTLEILPTKNVENGSLSYKANCADDDEESSESEDDDKSVDVKDDSFTSNHHLAMARDDGCVQVYSFTESDELVYYKSLPRASGRALSVTWSPDASFIYSGSSDGFIRCWDAKLGHEIYRITVGLGGLGSGSELCIWALLALRCGTLVSGDSSGSVQFWDSKLGTLLQAHSLHKGDIHALAVAPTHNRVFSAGADGQVILYKLSSNTVGPSNDKASVVVMKKWVYVGYIRAHTHDVRALTVAVPICREAPLPNKSSKKARVTEKPNDFSYQQWAQLGVPMLISAGDDTKLFAYSAKEFSQFSPHDICPAPQRVPTQLVLNTVFNKYSLLLVQGSFSIDILCVRIKGGSDMGMGYDPSGGRATTDLLARVKSKACKKIICSTMSTSGAFFAYSDHVKPNLFELAKTDGGKSTWTVKKRQLPRKLPYAHCMVFSPDCSRLMIAGHDRKIYAVDVQNAEVVHTFTPRRSEQAEELPPLEPPITKMFTSSDGQWLAAINCFGDVYIFNLEIQRQHWFISRLDGASVTAGGFPPDNNNVLIITTSLNQVYAFDVDAKKLGEWSMQHTYVLPRRYQEFPGEVTGLSFLPSSTSSSVIIYSARAMCFIDFGKPVDPDEKNEEIEPDLPSSKKTKKLSSINGLLKRKLKQQDIEKPKLNQRANFDFCAFRDPALFVGYLSNNSILVIEKPWMEVVRSFDAKPVHRHIYGS